MTRDGSQSCGRFTTGQRSVLATGEELGNPGTQTWQVAVLRSLKERLRASQEYQVEIRPESVLCVSQAVTPMNIVTEIYSLAVERKVPGFRTSTRAQGGNGLNEIGCTQGRSNRLRANRSD